MPEPADHSPLSMVTQEPLVNALIGQLAEARRSIASGDASQLVFSRTNLDAVRAAYARSLLQGEARLHRLCELLARTLFHGPYEMESVVIGEVASSGERFTLSQPLSRDVLYGATDLDLGSRLLRKIRIREGSGWANTRLVSNVVQYQPLQVGPEGVHRMLSRIKAEEELWNKVVDELFALDRLVDRDKELRALSRYVKDVFGVKIVVGTREDVEVVHRRLRSLRWSSDLLYALDLPSGDSLEHLEFVEIKDYLAERAKQSGWEAMKSVVRWWGGTFEIQVQPLENWFREREHLTRESHAGHKARREDLRERIAARDPVFAFYRDLLQWLFREPGGDAPALPGVEVEVTP